MLAAAFALLPLAALAAASAWLLLPALLAPAAWRLRADFVRTTPGLACNALLFRCFRLQLAFATTLAAGAVLARWASGWSAAFAAAG